MKKFSIHAFVVFAILFFPMVVHAEVRDVSVSGTLVEGRLEQEILDLVNNERRNAGVEALSGDVLLENAARQRAIEAGTCYDEGHLRCNKMPASTVLAEYGISYHSFGENLAFGYQDVEVVFDAWKNSLPHYNNIISSNYQSIGIGIFKSSDGNWYWALEFSDSLGSTYTPNSSETFENHGNFLVKYDDSIYPTYSSSSLEDVELSLSENDTIDFSIITSNEITNSNVNLHLLNWSSSNPLVVDISNDGYVMMLHAVGEGVSTVSAWFAGCEYSFQVVVKNPNEDAREQSYVRIEYPDREDLIFDIQDEDELSGKVFSVLDHYSVNETEYDLEGTILNKWPIVISYCSNVECTTPLMPQTVESDDPDLFQWQDEEFIFQNSGQTTITAIFENGLSVRIPVDIVGYHFEKEEYSLFVGDEIGPKIIMDPSVLEKEKTFSSSSEEIAFFGENNVLVAKEEGECLISSFVEDNIITYARVHVYPKEAITISVDQENIELTEGEEINIGATVDDSFATLSYESSNEDIVVVLEDGRVFAKKAGVASILITAQKRVSQDLINTSDTTISITVLERIIPISDIIVNEDQISLFVGDEIELHAQILPSNATYQDLSWSSSDTSVATVDSNGKVSAVTAGNSVITVTCSNGISKTISLEVKEISSNPTIAVLENEITLSVHEEKQIEVIKSSQDIVVTFHSDDLRIASVSENGLISALEEGDTTITVSSGDDDLFVLVHVIPLLEVSRITFQDTSIIMNVNDEKTIQAYVYPEVLQDKVLLEWKSTNEEVATVESNGTIHAYRSGSTTIIASYSNGVSASLNVVVREKEIPVEALYVENEELHLEVGDVHTLIVGVLPENADEFVSLKWHSSNPYVFTILDNGTIRAVGVGDAYLTISLEDNDDIFVKVLVTVSKKVIPITDISLSSYEVTLVEEESASINVTLLPSDANEDMNLTWKSEDPYVASVYHGIITALGAGRTTITVMTDSGISKRIVVVVNSKPKEERKTEISEASKPIISRRSEVSKNTTTSNSREVKEESVSNEFNIVFDNDTAIVENENGRVVLKIDDILALERDSISLGANEKLISFYEISYLEGGNSTFSNPTFTVRFPITFDESQYESVYVAFISGGGVDTKFTTVVNNGYIQFSTDHFSKYAVIGVLKENNDIPLEIDDSKKVPDKNKKEPKQKKSIDPQTKKMILLTSVWVIAFLFLCSMVFLLLKGRRKND